MMSCPIKRIPLSSPSMRFAFGKNWKSFSSSSLTEERVKSARDDLENLLSDIPLKGSRFVDIGFGQGLTLCLAASAGAHAMGLDIDADNLMAIETTAGFVGCTPPPPVRVASILDPEVVEELRSSFDVVHSWGVLHHTGDMETAVAHACELVRENGYFVCAIYNRHWSSLPWKAIKFFYNILPEFGQRLLIAVMYPVIYLAKLAVTGKNPKDKDRGMEFYHDVVDWVGGYPYEYASIGEFVDMVRPHGFECLRSIPAEVPTGCNQFVFQRTRSTSETPDRS